MCCMTMQHITYLSWYTMVLKSPETSEPPTPRPSTEVLPTLNPNQLMPRIITCRRVSCLTILLPSIAKGAGGQPRGGGATNTDDKQCHHGMLPNQVQAVPQFSHSCPMQPCQGARLSRMVAYTAAGCGKHL
jgi:hypothetical protein